MSTIEKDTVAMVHYRGTFPEDGEEFDSSHGSEPLAYLVGHQGMIPGFEREMIWHNDRELPKSDLVVLPGGFSYGDYLRCGSMA